MKRRRTKRPQKPATLNTLTLLAVAIIASAFLQAANELLTTEKAK